MNTAYFKGTVIDPKSLVTFERCCIEDFKLGDKVKFKLRDSYDITYEGSIICTGRANVISAAVVKLKGKEKSDIIQYQINEIVDSKYNNDITPLLIVPASMLQKQEDSDLLQINGIILVNPKSVKVSNGKSVEEKSIIFTSGDTRHTAILKWKGLIGKRFCVGIEIDFDTDWGTNGTFVDKRLFVSQDKRGVLIPIDTLENSCLTGKHKDLVINSEIIDESCICCIKSMGNVKMLTKLKINDRIRSKNSSLNGICKWIGLVNKIPAIGVDLNIRSTNGTNGTFCKTCLFKCSLEQGALFKEEDLINVQLELKYLEDIQMYIIDPFNIRSIDNGKEFRISVIYKGNNMTKLLNIKWRGIVDLDLCVGCELSNETEYGSNGIFSEKKLFSCNDRKGVLIPVYEIKESCECLNQHKEIEKQSGMLNNFFRNIEWINCNSICCVEWLDKIKKWSQIQINSRIKYTKWIRDNGGICKWIGLINGKEAVGVEMDKDVGGSNGRFDFFDLFSCQAERGVLLLAEDVIHDIENEKIHFVTDKIVDVNKIWSIKSFVNKTTNGINIDDPVTTCINKQRFNGQLKWMGEINNEKCVGLDIEKEFDYGMDGVIKGNGKFRCMPGHGLVTLLDNITRDKDADTPHFIDEGIIDPNKYLKCQEKWDSKFLEERNIRKNGDVFVRINGSDRQMKMKGVLMWCGFMNKMAVGAVKLDKDHKHGTNGRFWRDQLFKCDEQRAIATSWNNIYQFLPFEQRQIPEEDRVFQDIDINSAVKYYYTADNEVKDLYGTVRWTGVNEDGGYLYGIELDDRLPQGTDGQFKNQRLFHCPNGHGVLAELNRVTKDTWYTESKFIKDIYISNTLILDDLKMIPGDQYVVNELVTINDEMKIHGRVQFSAKLRRQQLLGIFIPSDVNIIKDHSQIIISGKYFANKKFGLIVKKEVVSKFDKTLKYMNNSPVIDISFVKIFEDDESNNLKTGDVAKFSVNSHWLFGRVIRLQLLNGISCVNMQLINFDADTNQNIYVQQDRIQVVENIQLEAKLFNGIIIDTSSVISVEDLDTEELKIGDEVAFRLWNFNEKYGGFLKWIGKINSIHTAAVELHKNTDLLNQFSIPDSLKNHLSITSQKLVILVTLSGLHSLESIETVNRCFIKMYMSTNDVNIQQDLLNCVIAMRNKSILRLLINCKNKPINIELHQDLIPNLIIENDIESIKLLLENCINSDNSSSVFLNLAKFALSINDDDLFSLSMGKCTNKNATLSNGETFLTNLFKETQSESVINEVIGQRFFDVNVMNDKNESPVMLACQKLMVSTVEKIVCMYPILSNHRNISLNMTLEAENKLSELNRTVRDVLKITHLLNNAETQLYIECSICQDKHANVSFQCGHVVCDVCSRLLDTCHACSKKIITRTKLYWN